MQYVNHLLSGFILWWKRKTFGINYSTVWNLMLLFHDKVNINKHEQISTEQMQHSSLIKTCSLELLHTWWMGYWINMLIKCLFELLHPNELLIIVVLSAVRQKMCPCLQKIIVVITSAAVSIFICSSSVFTDVYTCVRSLIKRESLTCFQCETQTSNKTLFYPVDQSSRSFDLLLLPRSNRICCVSPAPLPLFTCFVLICFVFPSLPCVIPVQLFSADVLPVTWSVWTEPRSPVSTLSVPRGLVTGGHVLPSRHQSSLATARRVTEDATARQRWPSTGRTWAWASARSLPSASASWPY